MRVFGLLGLVLALVIAGLIAKKQLTTVAAPLVSAPGTATPGQAPADVRTPSRQVQQQVKDALDAAAQARKMPDEN